MIEKIVAYANVAFVRAFIPLSVLATIFSLTNTVRIEHFSLFIALGQILATIDHGICARLISTPKVGSHSRVINLYRGYFKTVGTLKLLVCVFVAVLSLVFGGEYLAFLVSLSYVLSELLIIYNLFSNSSISEIRYKEYYIFVILFFLSRSMFILLEDYKNSFFEFDNIDAVYFLISLIVGVLFVLINISINFKPIESKKLSSQESVRLQASQVISSLIFNKEYILLSLFSLTDKAATFAIVSRLMMLPLQVNSVVISKMWSDIANIIGVKKSVFIDQMFRLAVISSVTSSICVFYLLFTAEESIIYLLFVLFLFVLTNSFSGLSSAYATVDVDAIPTLTWYIKSTTTLFFTSILLYMFGLPELSIFASAVFFVFLGKRNVRFVRWS